MSAVTVGVSMKAYFGRERARPWFRQVAGRVRDHEALRDAGVDVIVVDTAHGHTKGVLERVRSLKRQYPRIEVIAGNIATAAAARALAEARARIPERVQDIPEGKLPTPDDAAGEVLPLEPPQAAGQRCKATDKLIAFERDARFCGRCGELYHKDGVPKRCLTCSARLRR